MFQPWRVKLRAAREAYSRGRIDEAGRLLSDPELREFLPAKKLLGKLAGQVAQRGRDHAARGESNAAWQDLDTAQHMGADEKTLNRLREELVRRVVSEAEELISADDPAAALSRLESLRRRRVTTAAVRQLQQIAEKLSAAQRLSRLGRIAEAESLLSAAAALRPQWSPLQRIHRSCEAKMKESRQLTEQLHAALAAENWTKVMVTAESLLAISPSSQLAQRARGKAWEAVGFQWGDLTRSPRMAIESNGATRAAQAPAGPKSNSESFVVDDHVRGDRFQLWIDGVGGYLVCTGDDVLLGQPVAGDYVDVPIVGDVSRRHARILRGGEGYVIQPIREVSVDGKRIARPTSLTDGCLIELGQGVRLRFRRPHALSATARLEFVSHHRTQPAADAILLMGETCILGPGTSSHVVCRDWPHDVILYRHEDQLHCRAEGTLEIDGVPHEGRGPLAMGSQVIGADFSLSLEKA